MLAAEGSSAEVGVVANVEGMMTMELLSDQIEVSDTPGTLTLCTLRVGEMEVTCKCCCGKCEVRDQLQQRESRCPSHQGVKRYGNLSCKSC